MLSLFSYIRNGYYLEAVISVLSSCFVVFCCLPIHELAHAYVATKLGDDTARLKGRLTFNPFSHLDPLGTIMIFLFGIGYAKPVPVSPYRLKKPRRDMALISLAGPISNLFMSFIAVFLYSFVVHAFSGTVSYAVSIFFYYAASINAVLAVFNLIPIPPLDGSKVLASVLPDKTYFKYMQYERYIMIALLLLLFLGVFDTPISYLSSWLLKLISVIPNYLFSVIF